MGEHTEMYRIKSIENKDYVYKRVGETLELADIEDKTITEKIQNELVKTKRKNEYINIMQVFEKEKFERRIINFIEYIGMEKPATHRENMKKERV